MEKKFEISIKIDRDKMKELDSNSKQSFIAFRNTICKLIAEKNKCSVVDAEFIFMDVATDNIMSVNVTEKQYNEIIYIARPLLSKCVIITETKMIQDKTVTISVKEYDELKRVKGLYFDLLGSLKSITNQFESQLENIIKRY